MDVPNHLICSVSGFGTKLLSVTVLQFRSLSRSTKSSIPGCYWSLLSQRFVYIGDWILGTRREVRGKETESSVSGSFIFPRVPVLVKTLRPELCHGIINGTPPATVRTQYPQLESEGVGSWELTRRRRGCRPIL